MTITFNLIDLLLWIIVIMGSGAVIHYVVRLAPVLWDIQFGKGRKILNKGLPFENTKYDFKNDEDAEKPEPIGM
jgi:hypothetical protein